MPRIDHIDGLDAMTVDQFVARLLRPRRRQGPGASEERLMLAVMEDAVAVLQRETGDPNDYRDTLTWLMDDAMQSGYRFTFRYIVEHFGWSASAIRRKLMGAAERPSTGGHDATLRAT